MSSLKKSKILDRNLKQNRYLFIAAICFLIYSIIEMTDCIFLILIVLNLAPNLYLSMGIIIPEIQQILTYQPIFFLPFFLSFTLMRVFATIGILKNMMWGFYIGVISLILTMILTMLFIPFGFIELFFCVIILIILLIGFFEKKPIVH